MTAKTFEFEKSLKELEEITRWFEQTDLDLDEGLAKFERGMELAAALKKHLAAVENRVETIRQKFTAGTTQEANAAANSADRDPFDPGQTGLF